MASSLLPQLKLEMSALRATCHEMSRRKLVKPGGGLRESARAVNPSLAHRLQRSNRRPLTSPQHHAMCVRIYTSRAVYFSVQLHSLTDANLQPWQTWVFLNLFVLV